MTVIGIDPSLNSTGICINEDGCYSYKLLSTKPSKKMLKASEDVESLYIIQIDKEPAVEVDKGSSAKGVLEAINASKNISYIMYYVKLFLTLYRPDYVVIEAPAFNASGRIIDLSGLNHAIRLECIERKIPFYPISPTSVKMETVGNGQATKEMMIQTWLELFPEFQPLKDMKIDDLADAWALTVFPLEKIQG